MRILTGLITEETRFLLQIRMRPGDVTALAGVTLQLEVIEMLTMGVEIALLVEIKREDTWEAMKHSIQEVGVDKTFRPVAILSLLQGPVGNKGLHLMLVGGLWVRNLTGPGGVEPGVKVVELRLFNCL